MLTLIAELEASVPASVGLRVYIPPQVGDTWIDFPGPLPLIKRRMKKNSETIILGGGCFWCTQAVFSRLEGVLSTQAGYCGGDTPHPSYREVCTGSTGHAEVVRVEFDPQRLLLEDLLRAFFSTHDPTTPDRQGNDVGAHYRSIVFCEDSRQISVVGSFISDMEAKGLFSDPIVTQVVSRKPFYPAEESHQEYFSKFPNAPYCRLVIQPKIDKMDMK